MNEFNNLWAYIENNETIIQEENPCDCNPFKTWVEHTYNTSKELVEDGTDINPFSSPTLVPLYIGCTKLLPLSSTVIIPVSNYGSETASSAPVESSFKKFKPNTFKQTSLPIDIEQFLDHHILPLKGASFIHSTREDSRLSKYVDRNNIDINLSKNIEVDYANVEEEIRHPGGIKRTKCPLCTSGTLPFEHGAYKCVLCKKPLCSTHIPKHDDKRDCLSCDYNNNIHDEAMSKESWNKKRETQNSSYLVPNPHLQHLNLSNNRTIKSLPLLKNGSCYGELKGYRIKNKGPLTLTNTCAFDTLTAIIMVAYCDSDGYCTFICDNSLPNNTINYFNFIIEIIKNGISASTYNKRAEIILQYLQPQLKTLEYGGISASCEDNVGHIIKILFNGFPTAIETINCSNNCVQNIEHRFEYWQYQTNIKNDLSGLQHFVNQKLKKRTKNCKKNCNGKNFAKTIVSPSHLFFDILYWKREDAVSHLRTLETATFAVIKLKDILPVISTDCNKYELRGVVSLIIGKCQLGNTIGHYIAYIKRKHHNWEIHNDLLKKVQPINENTEVPCEYLVYTI